MFNAKGEPIDREKRTARRLTEDPQRPESIQIDKLIAVPASVEISDEFGLRDHDRPRVVVRMKAQGVLLPQIPVEKQVHVIFRVVDQSNGDTEPGRSPRYRSIRCSEANESFPCRSRRSRSRIARFRSQSKTTR